MPFFGVAIASVVTATDVLDQYELMPTPVECLFTNC